MQSKGVPSACPALAHLPLTSLKRCCIIGGRGGEIHQAAKLVKEEELVRLLLAGFMLRECSVHMGMSYKTIRDYARQPHFMGRLKEMSSNIYERVDEELRSSKDNITARLEAISEDALEEMYRTAKELPIGMAKIKALQDLLDRDGRVSRQRKDAVQQSHSFVDPLFLVHAAGVAREVDAKVLKEAGDDKQQGRGDGE